MSAPLATGKVKNLTVLVKNKRVRESTEINGQTAEGPSNKTAKRDGNFPSSTHVSDAQGSAYFRGITALLVESGVLKGRLQVWRRQLEIHGAQLSTHLTPSVTHVVASSWQHVVDRLGKKRASNLKQVAVSYGWIEESLTQGHIQSTAMYHLHPPGEKNRAVSSSSPPTHVSESESPSFQPLEATDTLSPARHPGQPQKKNPSEGSGGSPDRTPVRAAGRSQIYHSSAQTSLDWLRVIRDSADIGRTGGKRVIPSDHSDSEGEMESSRRGGEEEWEGPSMNPRGVGSPESEYHDPTYSPPDVNRRITEIFTQMKDIYKDALGDGFRSFSYQKAVSVLEKLPFEISDVDQINGLPAVGPSLRDQIEEIVTSGKLQRLEKFKKDSMVQTIILFTTVHGIGPVAAHKFYSKGYRTLEQLGQEPSLTAGQRLGIKFHSDLSKKIPREEVVIMEKIVQQAAESLVTGISVLCSGSYRRGKLMVGDMDFVITHPDGLGHAGMLPRLLERLRGGGELGEGGFVAEEIATPSIRSAKDAAGGVDTFMGLCKFPGREQRHRIDIKVYPWKMYPFGLIAWTGNTVLNRRLRHLADTKGYVLDDHGLFPAVRDSHGQKVAQAERGLLFGSEKEVFDFLGFKYLEPHDRNL